MSRHFLQSPSRQQGLTLVELMVAMALGLILIAGVLWLFVNTRQANQTNQTLNEIQDSGRFALQFLKTDLQKSGWSNQQAFPAAASQLDEHIDGAATRDDQIIPGGDGQTTDVLTIQYHGATDCMGAVPAGPAGSDGVTRLVTNSYRLQTNADETSFDLACNGQPLIRNVERFEVVYGVDFGAASGARYFTADAVAATDWAKVRWVNLGLVMRAAREQGPDKTQSVFLFNEELPVTDGYMRKVFETSIHLPNYPRIAD